MTQFQPLPVDPVTLLHHVSSSIGWIGVSIIAFGVAAGLVRFIRSETASCRGMDVELDRRRLRQNLGYYLLLGLEFLIAADIIDTLQKPELRDLLVLGSIVAIRTVIGISLNGELKHSSTEPPYLARP